MDSQIATQISSGFESALGCRLVPQGGMRCNSIRPIVEFAPKLLSFGEVSKQHTKNISIAGGVVIVPLVIFSIVAIGLIYRKRKRHKKPLQLQLKLR
jgi:hypothetical protein